MKYLTCHMRETRDDKNHTNQRANPKVEDTRSHVV